MNWKNNPVTVTMSRSAIMKEVTKKVLSSVNNLNVGLMRFNPDGPAGELGVGGSVSLDITDLDANRQTVLDAVEALPADGYTPLSETMYENALCSGAVWPRITALSGGTRRIPMLLPAARSPRVPERL